MMSALIVVAGLCQYRFILLRTAQNAPYLEARASNLGELFAVMRATRFSDRNLRVLAPSALVERVPELWHLSVLELNPLGIVLAFVGIAAVIVRRNTIGVLLITRRGRDLVPDTQCRRHRRSRVS